MFDSVCIRRQFRFGASQPINLGFLAEAMLFYQKVHLIADMEILQHLVPAIGPDLLNEFIEEGHLTVSYVEKRAAIQTYNTGTPQELYRPVFLWEPKGKWQLDQAAAEIFNNATTSAERGKRLGRRFVELVPAIDLSYDVLDGARTDYVEQAYTQAAVVKLLQVLAPTYQLPRDYHFHVERDGETFRVETNIDFIQANNSFNQRYHTTGVTLNVSALLLYLLEARNDLFFAGQTQAELATQPANAVTINTKFQRLMAQRDKSQQQIDAFQLKELKNAHEIGESLLLGYRSWKEFLALLKRVPHFKKWVGAQEPDANLLVEYYASLAKDPLLASLPVKIVRFLIFTGGGLFLPAAASLIGSFADSFLLDKLLGGWKPNQFVDGPLKGFARLDKS